MGFLGSAGAEFMVVSAEQGLWRFQLATESRRRFQLQITASASGTLKLKFRLGVLTSSNPGPDDLFGQNTQQSSIEDTNVKPV